MAARSHFTSRVLSKYCRDCCFRSSRSRNIIASQSIWYDGSKRKVHSFSKRQSAATSIINNQTKVSPLRVPHGSFLVRVQRNGLHVTCVVPSADNDALLSNSPVETNTSELFASDVTINPVSGNSPAEVNTGDIPLNDLTINPVTDASWASPFDTAQDIITSGVAEPTLTSLGLGGYTPIGGIQYLLDFAHGTLGMPWWSAIVCGTIIARLILLPVMVKTKRVTVKMSNVKPEIDKAQQKLRDAQNLQNPAHQAAASMEFKDLMTKNGINPAVMLMGPLTTGIIFISYFVGLRRMAELPIESMKTGGMLWFSDLTLADPFYILPIVNGALMFLAFEFAAEEITGGSQMGGNPQNMKNVMRGMAVVVTGVGMFFPSAILTYWITTSVISLGQSQLFKQPAVMRLLNIPVAVIHPIDPSAASKKSGDWLKNFRAGFDGAQKQQEMMKIEAIQEKTKKDKTYKEPLEYNPRYQQNEELFREARRTERK